jgi:hypothetical protein
VGNGIDYYQILGGQHPFTFKADGHHPHDLIPGYHGKIRRSGLGNGAGAPACGLPVMQDPGSNPGHLGIYLKARGDGLDLQEPPRWKKVRHFSRKNLAGMTHQDLQDDGLALSVPRDASGARREVVGGLVGAKPL